MERHRCKLCYRRFANGRALGGHMRSHVMPQPKPAAIPSPSNSSSSFAVNKKPVCMLGDNKSKACHLADVEFSSSGVHDSYESDAESSLPRPVLKRFRGTSATSEAEQMSSISDTTTEEDVAKLLMLLSRDSWYSHDYQRAHNDDEDEDYEDENDDEDEEEEEQGLAAKLRRKRTRFSCRTCLKVFRSYQALGGHKASHKRVGIECVAIGKVAVPAGNHGKIFECPYCDRVFISGQALGGHKRTHFVPSAAAAIGVAAAPVPQTSLPGRMNCVIDLNMPAPLDDEMELSAVSFTGPK